MSYDAQTAQDIVDKHKFLVVSKSWCPDCVYAKRVFSDLKTEPYYLELDNLENGPQLQEAFLELSGQNTVPNVFIDKEHIGTEHDIARLLANGELKEKLQRADLIKN